MDIAALEVLVIELVSGNFQIRCCFKLDESDSVLVMSIKRSGERTPTLCHHDHGQLRSRLHPVLSAERNLSDPKIQVSRRPPVEQIPKLPRRARTTEKQLLARPRNAGHVAYLRGFSSPARQRAVAGDEGREEWRQPIKASTRHQIAEANPRTRPRTEKT